MNTLASSDPLQPQEEGPNPTKSTPEEIRLDIPTGKKLILTLHLEENASLDLQVQKETQEEVKVQSLHFKNPTHQNNLQTLLTKTLYDLNIIKLTWQSGLILLALLVYLATRLIALDSFPIYFFTDEAVQTVLAADLVHSNLQNYDEEMLPTYFVNGGQYNLGVSVYIQILPYLVFGKNIWVTRGVCVLFSLLAALGIGLAMRNIYQSRQPFLAILLLSITPAWFLHSRTAFETTLAVSFYAAFIYCYLMYRKGSLNYLFAAVGFAALTFYSYSPAQMVVAVTLAGLFFSDLPYHWKNRRKILLALGLGALCLFPYLRFVFNYPSENVRHLQILNSYWIQSIPFIQKLKIYFTQYLQMLDPRYWFLPTQFDLIRHVMKGYGNLLWWTFPLVLLGLILTFLRVRKSEYRVLLILLLAAPSGAALVSTGITRALFMVIPAALLAALALDQIIEWLSEIRLKRSFTAGFCLAALMVVNGYMLVDALNNGPTWFDNYGLDGMQYGAKEVFAEAKEYIKENPKANLMLSSAWANGTDVLARYFFNDPLPIHLGSIEMWINEYRPLDDNNVFVVIPEEMDLIQGNPKFKFVDVLKTIPYPNGVTGFYFVKVAYADNIKQILADEAAARQQLKQSQITLQDGTEVAIQFPTLDMGYIQDAFDGNDLTLIRSLEANPLLLKLHFDKPYTLNQITLRIGGAPTTIKIIVTPADGSSPQGFQKVVPVSNDYRNIIFSLDNAVQISQTTISVKNTDDKEPSHVHLWEVTLK